MVDIYSRLQDLNHRVERLESNSSPPRTYKYIYTAEIAEDPNFPVGGRPAHYFHIAADDLTETLAGLLQVYPDDRILKITRKNA